MIFTLDDSFQQLDWHHSGEKPTLDKEEAMIVAVASVAKAIEFVGYQIGNTNEIFKKSATN